MDRKNAIIMSGWEIYPKEVEEALLKHQLVKEAAAFAGADELQKINGGVRKELEQIW